jgi:hypothetical protein
MFNNILWQKVLVKVVFGNHVNVQNTTYWLNRDYNEPKELTMEKNDDNKTGFHVQIKQMSIVHDSETYLSNNHAVSIISWCSMSLIYH